MRISIKEMTTRLRRWAGFTMSEVLVVIAILAVLAAVAIPGLISLRQNLMITRLDDTAKEMYVAAQNTMTRLSNSDSLAKLEGAPLPAEPSDFGSGNWSVSKADYFYGAQSSDAAKLLLPAGAIDDSITTGGFFVIEYNKKTASVYSVFYAEKSFIADYPQLCGDEGFRLSRDARKELLIGYYGGGSVTRDDFARCATPIITVENDDTLKLSITGAQAGYTVRAVLRDSAGHTAELKSSDLGSPITMNADNSFSLVMDSLPGDRFHTLFPSLTSGDDIHITVYFEKSDPLNPCLSSFTTTSVNSLFASRTGAEAGIAYARHLQNLDAAWSGVSGITSAVQLGHIQWPASQTLDSIDNSALKSYDGNKRQIGGLTGTNGLFGSLSDAALSDIVIVNPKINSSAASTGVLAGTLSNCTVSGCQVYAYEVSGGKVNFAAYDAYGLSATGTVGGLVGTMSGGSVDMSFAALPHIYSWGQSAGFIGSATSVTVTNCYSACDELSGASAMFIASSSGSAVSHCYAVGNCGSTTDPLDFIPGGAAISDSYCAFSYVLNGTKRAPTSYYVIDGALSQYSADTLNDHIPGGNWGTSSAAMTRPYSQALDGRAYPFKSIPGLRHFGSWPLEGGIMVTVDFLLDTGADGSGAGRILVFDEKGTTTLYMSDSPNLSAPFEVPVGEKVNVVIDYNPGYSYLYSDVTGDTGRVTAQSFATAELQSDTTISAVFRQMTFPLSCEAVTYAENGSNGTYRVYVGSSSSSVSMLPGSTRNVYADSNIIVVPENRDSLYVAYVWYSPTGDNSSASRVEVYRDENGEFSFTMPSAATSLHVMYTKKFATYNIYYHRQDVDGQWPEVTTYSDQILLGIGETITGDFVRHFADVSNIAVTIDGEPCIYYDPALTELKEKGNTLPLPFTSADKDSNKDIEIHIYFRRSQHSVTLLSGENISSVQLSGGSANASTVTKTYYYGKNVTAIAAVSGSNSFTEWVETSSSFAGSTAANYSFAVPSYDITLKASAVPGYRRISLRVFKDGDSWLLHGQSIYLQNTETNRTELMENLTDPTKSFLSEKSVPSGRYYVMFSNGEYYTLGGKYYLTGNDWADDRLVLDCTNRSVEDRLDFYTVTFYPNCSRSYGSVPAPEIHPSYHLFQVPGNSGALRRTDDLVNNVFSGWYDSYVTSMSRGTYGKGDTFFLTRRTSLFAVWQPGLEIVYNGNSAVSGDLPYDSNDYAQGDTVTLKYPDEGNPLSRTGYDFKGWFEDSNRSGGTDPDKGDTLYPTPAVGETRTVTFAGTNIELLAHWVAKSFAVTRYDASGNPIGTQTVSYQAEYTLPGYTPASGYFVGWATAPNGAVRYRAGDTLSVEAALGLYARVAVQTVNISYMKPRWAGSSRYIADETITVGKDVPFYIDSSVSAVAWSKANDTPIYNYYTVQSYSGSPYYCDENGISLTPVSFSDDTRLYPISDKVYNSERGLWYSTLYDAVDDASNNNTLVVYGDTVETEQITIDKPLFIVANGNRTIKWADTFSINGAGVNKGCLRIQSTLCLGAASIDGAEMGSGNALTFDANNKCRVVSLQGGGSLYMYDGVTLTNGTPGRKPGDTVNQSSDFAYFGGGVYAANNSNFYMRGGTVSYCSAYIGGGVYLNTGSHMEMGRMVNPGSIGQGYMDGGTYYKRIGSGSTMYYELDNTVTSETYGNSFVPYGYPQICFNSSFRTANVDDSDSAGDGGGGLFLRDLTQNGILLYSGEVSFNSSSANGGGILTDSANNGVMLRIYNVEICDNIANNGGGIFQWQGTVYVYNSNLSRNYARNSGGGLYLNRTGSETSNLEFHYGDIIGNQAAVKGGAVYVENGSDIIMTGGNLLSNSANLGGAAYLEASGDFLLSGGYISGNGNADIYMNASYSGTSGRITVPSGGLHTNRPLHASDSDRIILECSNPRDGLVVVRYASSGDFVDTDANYFQYVNTDFAVLPSTNSALVLGPDSDSRTVTFYENRGAAGSNSVHHDYTFGENGDILDSTELADIADEMQLRNLVGYKFMGWATRSDAALGEVVTEYTVSNLYGQALYAVWDYFKVTFDVSNAPSSVITPSIANGPTVTLPTPEASGGGEIVDYNDDNTLKYVYTFLGWSATQNSTTVDAGFEAGAEIHDLAADITLYSVWKRDQAPSHDISFDPNGATGNVLAVPVSEGLSLAASRGNFSRAGYELISWNTVQSPTEQNPGQSYLPDEMITMATSDIYLFAQWEASEYPVSFHRNDGSPDDLISDEIFYYGQTLVFPPDPSREHYSFLGWAENPNSTVAVYDPALEYQVIGPLTLYAVWQIDTYSVSFDPNTGSGGIVPLSIAWGESAQLPSVQPGISTTGSISKTGYVLTSWNTSADGSGLSIEPEALVSIGDGGTNDLIGYADANRGVVLYAQWTAQHRVTFDTDGGSAAPPAQDVLEWAEIILPADPTKEGFAFGGWSNALGGAPLPEPITMGTSDFTLYAVWVELPPDPLP